MDNMKKFQCKHCKGIVKIEILKDTEKATMPKIEFCPFCGTPNQYQSNF
ncbi:hypothetical protein KAW96_05690 [candidate division WOR-3 bacterium]|nr:hypothetical protein [candidate division WOR-3 bacterium]